MCSLENSPDLSAFYGRVSLILSYDPDTLSVSGMTQEQLAEGLRLQQQHDSRKRSGKSTCERILFSSFVFVANVLRLILLQACFHYTLTGDGTAEGPPNSKI